MSELADFLDTVWNTLAEGMTDPEAPAHLPVFATASGARTVVLRGFDKAERTLSFYTHAQSSKVADLVAHPKAQVLVWDAAQSLQIRLSCTVHMAAASDALWAGQGDGARQNYAFGVAPGSEISAPGEGIGEPQQALMTVLTARIESIDALSLAALPHRRARFTAPDFTGVWIAP